MYLYKHYEEACSRAFLLLLYFSASIVLRESPGAAKPLLCDRLWEPTLSLPREAVLFGTGAGKEYWAMMGLLHIHAQLSILSDKTIALEVETAADWD